MTKGHDKGHKGQMSDRDEPWDTTDMAHRAGGLSMEQDEIVPSDYSGVTGDYMEQEPVAWLVWTKDGHAVDLYTAPPKREWQGLTDEEIAEGAKQSWVDKQAFESAVWWAEEKLKEKNA